MTRTLITSAIPYINGIKHLGNLVGSQLPADLYARYRRLRGDEVLFICATDEHGTPAELAAAAAGKPVAEYCAEMHDTQKRLGDGFGLSFNHFGRSSSDRNRELTQRFAARLADNGYISVVEEEGIYSKADGRFLPDRYIRGECPECGYEQARGDQCENCTKQLDPKDLINPRSAISGSSDLEVRKTKHLHLMQSCFRKEISDWIDSKSESFNSRPARPYPDDRPGPAERPWPVLTTSIAKKWLHDGEGLQDRGITRDLDWGVPVPRGRKGWEEVEGKVFYVWFDAPIEYIAATAEWAEANDDVADTEWESWWRLDKGADDVTYVQFMGKDNVPFHTLSFPATLFGARQDWKHVDYIKAFNFLNYDGGQFSTSLGRGVFMDQALELLPSDYWRWWLLSHAPEHSDSEFTWENFADSVNKDLADVLGNFASRVTKFCRSHFGEKVPEEAKLGESGNVKLAQRLVYLAAKLYPQIREYEAHMDDMEVRKSARQLRSIWAFGNEFLQAAAPWVEIQSDKTGAAISIALSLNLLRIFAVLSKPFIPDTAEVIMRSLATDDWSWPEPNSVIPPLCVLKSGHRFSVPENLFRKVSDTERDKWHAKFAGK